MKLSKAQIVGIAGLFFILIMIIGAFSNAPKNTQSQPIQTRETRAQKMEKDIKSGDLPMCGPIVGRACR